MSHYQFGICDMFNPYLWQLRFFFIFLKHTFNPNK